MANIPKVGFSQAPSGSPLSILDQSTLDSPIGNYVRTVELYSGKDATGSLLDVLTFTGSNLSVDKVVTSDRYYSAKLTHTGSPTIPPVIINFTTQEFSQKNLNNILKANCGCGKTKNCGNMSLGFLYMYQSQVATKAGNSGLANSFINTSFKLLTS